MQFSCIKPIDRALLGAAFPGQSGHGSDGNEGVFPIPQSYRVSRTSTSDSLLSYPGHLFGGGLTPLLRCSRCILQPQPTGQYKELSVKTVLFLAIQFSPSTQFNCEKQ